MLTVILCKKGKGMIVHTSHDGYLVKFNKSEQTAISLLAAAVGEPPRVIVDFIIRNGLVVTDLDSVKVKFK